MRKLLRSLLLAFGFLTVIPGLGRIKVQSEDIGNSTVFYPLVGAAIGFCTYLLCLLPGLSHLTLSVIVCICILFLSRGMHADGLIDTFDGFLSGKKEKEAVIAIMRDSRVGALGFLAAFSLYFLKICMIYELLRHEAGGLRSYLVSAPALSRGGVAAVAAFFRPASDSGLGKSCVSSTKKWHALLSFLFMILFCFPGANPMSLLLAPVTVFIWIVWALICKHKIGGMSGDTIGAGIELSELFCIIMVLILFG